MSYAETSLDWTRLRRHASNVARELGGHGPATRTETYLVDVTAEVGRWPFKRNETRQETRERKVATPGSSWLISIRNSQSRSNHGRGDYTEDHESVTYYLQWDGRLTFELDTWECGLNSGRWWNGGHDISSREMNEHDVLSFDHRQEDPRKPVWAPSKGVGLSAKLSKMRDAHRAAGRPTG